MRVEVQTKRKQVTRTDGTTVNIVPKRGHLLVCASGCCCGLEKKNNPPVPVDRYQLEWEERKLRNLVHLTFSGCLGPCPLANVALLLFDGHPFWFHSVNNEKVVVAIYDYIEALLQEGPNATMPPILAERAFNNYAWPPPDPQSPIPDA